MQMTLQPLWRKVATQVGNDPSDPNYASSSAIRCENGDPFALLVNRIVDLVADEGQNFINFKLVDKANDVFESIEIPGLGAIKDGIEEIGSFVGDVGSFVGDVGSSIGNFFGRRLFHDVRTSDPDSLFGRPIPRVCFPVGYNPRKCDHGYMTMEQAARLAECENSRYGLEEMCYFARVCY